MTRFFTRLDFYYSVLSLRERPYCSLAGRDVDVIKNTTRCPNLSAGFDANSQGVYGRPVARSDGASDRHM